MGRTQSDRADDQSGVPGPLAPTEGDVEVAKMHEGGLPGALKVETVADDRIGRHRFVIGKLGSLAETKGKHEAEKFLDKHAGVETIRVGAAKRLGRTSLNG